MSDLVVEPLLKEYGLKPTPQRLAIARLLFSRTRHVSADELRQELAGAGERISKATVYNTLNLFARKGLLREVNLDSARTVYDSNLAPHHHLYDVDSGELTDIPSTDVRVEGLPELPAGTRVEAVDVVVRVRRDAGAS